MGVEMVVSGKWLLALGLGLVASGGAGAHTLLVDCYKVTEEIVACRGDYGDGQLAGQASFSLYDEKNVLLGTGKTDEHGVYVFRAPPVDYVVVITSGAAHVASLSSADIAAKPRRPGWGGDWVPVATVDRLQKMRQWEAQFTSEKAPLVQKLEDEVAK
jgi:hypothetical protein